MASLIARERAVHPQQATQSGHGRGRSQLEAMGGPVILRTDLGANWTWLTVGITPGSRWADASGRRGVRPP